MSHPDFVLQYMSTYIYDRPIFNRRRRILHTCMRLPDWSWDSAGAVALLAECTFLVLKIVRENRTRARMKKLLWAVAVFALIAVALGALDAVSSAAAAAQPVYSIGTATSPCPCALQAYKSLAAEALGYQLSATC